MSVDEIIEGIQKETAGEIARILMLSKDEKAAKEFIAMIDKNEKNRIEAAIIFTNNFDAL